MPLKPATLFLHALPDEVAATAWHHTEALASIPEFSTRTLKIAWELPPSLDLNRFDVILIHYSLAASEYADSGPLLLSQRAVSRVARSSALKGIFLQDEHRNVWRMIDALRQLQTDIVFTCVPELLIETVYPEDRLPGIRKVNVLTGYVHDSLLGRSAMPYSERLIDVGYRARHVPYWLGSLARDKWRIAERFLADRATFGLVCDISTRAADRLNGEAWLDFLGRCKTVLGTESGASVIDFDGHIRKAVDADVKKNPDITFEEIFEHHLKEFNGKYSMAQISPRCFEAAAMKTLMILYEGYYSGRLMPWRHYVPLKKDHSNMAEVVAAIRDEALANRMTQQAYDEVALAPENSYRALQHIVREAAFTCCPFLTDHDIPEKGYRDSDWKQIAVENERVLRRIGHLRRIGRELIAAGGRILPGDMAQRIWQWLAGRARSVVLRH